MKFLTMTIPIGVRAVARWGYEKAFCDNYIAELNPGIGSCLDEEIERQVDEYHEALARAFGGYRDNKETFEVSAISHRSNSATPLYITFHDGRMFVGMSIRPYRGTELPKPDKILQ